MIITGGGVVAGGGIVAVRTPVPENPALPFTGVQPVHVDPFRHALPSEQQ